jgi:hypothetical protein
MSKILISPLLEFYRYYYLIPSFDAIPQISNVFSGMRPIKYYKVLGWKRLRLRGIEGPEERTLSWKRDRL